MTAWQGADDIDDERAARDREWVVDASIDADLARVCAGDLTRWFVADGPLPGHSDKTVCEAEPAVWPRTSVVRVEGRLGLLVPRCEGGLLVDGLRKRGGMDAPLALGVLDEALAVLEDAPPPPRGASRTAMRGFAVDGRGDIVVLPGRLRDAASRTDAAELGELLHLALTGRTWEQTGLPLALSAPDVPVAVTTLVTDLLEGDDGDVDRSRLRARIAALGPSRERGFLPAEPGVPEDTAPTGTLGADVVSALRGARPGGADPDVSPERGGSVRSRPRSGRARHGERRRRGARARAGRARMTTVSVIALCCTGVLAGVGLMVKGATGVAPHAQPRTGSTAMQTPEPELSTEEPSASTEEPAASAEEPAGTTADDPLTAVVELSRLRAEAFADADGDALALLTVPGSPAATADADLGLDECEDCADVPGPLELSDVHSAARTDAPHDTEDAGHTDAGPQTAGTGDGDRALADGERAYVGATMRTQDSAPQQVVFVLERHRGAWRVHSVHAV
ncbi:hypothetical protein [Brevibacterium yomogidense]|uniref:hypothetical protein n=1 Tax=Brevibacterium yomogidense TaxID=946573 RepID=UPI0018DFD9D8|nr:hypothetical protein [Brevibacterium yomogidense]